MECYVRAKGELRMKPNEEVICPYCGVKTRHWTISDKFGLVCGDCHRGFLRILQERFQGFDKTAKKEVKT